jgi:peptidoglycan hydrolase-like protein with peptidoglycan-binding domain
MRRFWQLLALCVAVFLVAPAARASDVTNMSAAEIKALQQRLADGGCYQGAIDGQASPALADAIKACPSQEPILRIETGMHVAGINRISVDRACRVAGDGFG